MVLIGWAPQEHVAVPVCSGTDTYKDDNHQNATFNPVGPLLLHLAPRTEILKHFNVFPEP